MKMQRWLRHTRRTRLKIALLAVLAMLFQQVALASYLCSPADMPHGNAAMAAHCDGMPMPDETAPAGTAPALCAQHCAQQATTTQDARLPNVPPLLLPALLPAGPMVAVAPISRTVRESTTLPGAPGLPPPLRHQVLLI